MRIEILPSALQDLADGFAFYEDNEPGIGSYFLDSLYADIDSLKRTAGIHAVYFAQYHRDIALRFPYAIFYTMEKETVFVHAVLDCRRDPKSIRERLR